MSFPRADLIVSMALSLACSTPAQIGGTGQLGPFIPDRDTALDTTWNGGRFEFTQVFVPSWVTVTVTGPNPLMLLSQGDVRIDGRILANGEDGSQLAPGRGGAGGWSGGAAGTATTAPERGFGPGGGPRGLEQLSPPVRDTGGAAGHRQQGGLSCQGKTPPGQAYGSADPLAFQGGSGGGGDAYPLICTTGWSEVAVGGGGGGGAVAILSDGMVTIAGILSANGGVSNGPGSGGTIAIRALGGISVSNTGTVLAKGANAAADGFIRLDSYGALPVIQGQIDPSPTSLGLPDLLPRELPTMGQTFHMRVVSLPNEQVALFVAPRAAQVAVPPVGTLKLDPLSMALVATGTTGSSEVDPYVEFPIPVPQKPSLLGLPLFWQGLVFQTPMPSPKLTNLFITAIQ